MDNLIHSNQQFPIRASDGNVWPHTVFLKNCIDQSNMQVGDYSYYNDFRLPVQNVRQLLAPYLHPSVPERLIIGKFVQIAHGVQFITSSANHQMDGFSTYPFAVFGEPWASSYQVKWLNKGDTVVGNDVWIGHEALIMPAVSLGDGAIIASRCVVTKDVPPYTIVGGNPAKIIRKRFNENMIDKLLTLKWWDWPIEKINRNIAVIVAADIYALMNAK